MGPVDAAFEELSSLIGLSPVKEDVSQLAAQARVTGERARKGLGVPVVTRHLVMTGRPGTGKTTVARLLGEIYCGYGLLETADVVETSAGELVSRHIGATSAAVNARFKAALGGVLFIDDADGFVDVEEGGFLIPGREAVDTLVPLLEEYRDKIMVVIAGRPEPMRKFLGENRLLAGRFGHMIHFPDFTDDELVAALQRFSEEWNYVLTEDAASRSRDAIANARGRMRDDFDNLRLVRRLFEGAVKRHGVRVGGVVQGQRRELGDAELRELTVADIPSLVE